MNPLIQRKTTFHQLLIAVAFGCFVVSPTGRAVSPAPDGGYPGSNTAEGEDSLLSLTSGFANASIGYHALYSNTTGSNNTALGFDALLSNTDGSDNTALGFGALLSNGASNNTAIGDSALRSNTTGEGNTAVGSSGLFSNTEGIHNTALGFDALVSNTTGGDNTSVGWQALYSNAGNAFGTDNTAVGSQALYSNVEGHENTAVGVGALYSNVGFGVIDAEGNTAVGYQALYSNTEGSENTAVGFRALYHNTFTNTALPGDNTAIGYGALFNNTTGRNNAALGASAGENLTTGDNNIDIGNQGVAGEANTTRIGTQGTQANTYVAGISGTTVAKGVGVVVDATGHLGTKPSSQRFKDEIKPMNKASEAILVLKPVAFRYTKAIDPERTQQFGLVAEDVEKVNPDLVARDGKGRPYTVRYDAVNAMLLNEFLKEHRRVQELEKQVKAITAGLQKVSAQLERKEAASRMASNDLN